MIIFTPNTVIKSTEVNGNFDELLTKTDYLTAPDSAWIAATYTNSWVTYDSVFPPARYRKDALGYVHLSGMIKSGTINTSAFTLPVGYRPLTYILLYGTQSSAGAGRVDIYYSGIVNIVAPSTNTWTTLDGIIFKAEQ